MAPSKQPAPQSSPQVGSAEPHVEPTNAPINLDDVQCGSDFAVAALREYLAQSITGGSNQFTMFVPIEQNRRIVNRMFSFKDFITIERGPNALLCSATLLIGTTPSKAARYELRVTDDRKSLIAREVR